MTVRGPLYGITNQAAGYTLPVPVSSSVQLKLVQVWAATCIEMARDAIIYCLKLSNNNLVGMNTY